MARTSITTARYNPFTMEELYSPVLRATEQHLQQQEKYDELANQMNVWKYRLPQDSEARALYDNYEKMFNAAVDDLNANGINNPSARDNARALIRENPIPAFIETQKQLDQINDTANKLNPTTTRWIHRPTFDDVLHGNTTMDYVDINDIEKKASDTIASVARTITQEPAFKKATGAGGQYFNVASTTGITDAMWEMAKRKKQGESSGNDELDAQLDRLNNAVTDIRTYSRIDEFPLDTKERNDIQGAIDRGLLNGSAITSYSVQRDNSDEMALRWANFNFNKGVQEAELKTKGFVPNGKGGYDYDPSVAAQFNGSGDSSSSSSGGKGGSSSSNGLDNPHEIYSFSIDKNGNRVLGEGNYTGDPIKKTAYTGVEDFRAKKSTSGEVIVPKIGWNSAQLDKTINFDKGRSMTMRDALMDVYKEKTGRDYKEYYNSLNEEQKKAFKVSNESQLADYLIKTELLPNYDIAFGSDNKKNGKAENWEMFIEEKSVEKKLAEQAAAKQNNEKKEKPKEQKLEEGDSPIPTITEEEIEKATMND